MECSSDIYFHVVNLVDLDPLFCGVGGWEGFLGHLGWAGICVLGPQYSESWQRSRAFVYGPSNFPLHSADERALCPSLLQAKLGVLDEDFAKWRFTFHSPRTGAPGEALADDEELYARCVCVGGRGGRRERGERRTPPARKGGGGR